MLAQAAARENQLTDTMRAVRDHFQQGGSLQSVLLILLGIVVVLLLVYWLTRQQQRLFARPKINDPVLLFDTLLERLNLPTNGRQILESAARQAQLNHPTVLLLSTSLFDRYIQQWTANQREKSDDKIISDVRGRLFPTGG